MGYTPSLYVPFRIPCNFDHHLRCGVFGMSCAMVLTKLWPHPCPVYEIPPNGAL